MCVCKNDILKNGKQNENVCGKWAIAKKSSSELVQIIIITKWQTEKDKSTSKKVGQSEVAFIKTNTCVHTKM